MSEAEEQQTEEELAEGTLLSHLVELRNRLLRMVVASLAVFVVLLPWRAEIFTFVARPLLDVIPGGELISVDPAGAFLVPVKLTFLVSVVIAMPIILYQIWAFVAPGLYRQEKRFAFPLVATSIALFYLGIIFAYYVVFPLAFGFFVGEAPEQVNPQTDIGRYVDFITTIIFAFGLAFETPIATVLIVWTGLTTPKRLGSARPYVFLGAFVVGMFITPPDAISQTLLAIPIYILFELGIIMSKIFVRREEEPDEEAAATE